MEQPETDASKHKPEAEDETVPHTGQDADDPATTTPPLTEPANQDHLREDVKV
jgi:hypothetical protein